MRSRKGEAKKPNLFYVASGIQCPAAFAVSGESVVGFKRLLKPSKQKRQPGEERVVPMDEIRKDPNLEI